MKNENCLREPDRVHRPVSPPCIVLEDFQDSGATKTLERLGCAVLVAALREVQGVAEEPANRRTGIGNAIRSFLLLPTP